MALDVLAPCFTIHIQIVWDKPYIDVSLRSQDRHIGGWVMKLNLTIELTDALTPEMTAALCLVRKQSLLICDRCHDVEAIVIATMKILPIGETWALCGACTSELPVGFHVT
jgi:hypothetical protein